MSRAGLPVQLGGKGNTIPPPVNDTSTTRQVLRGQRDPREEVMVWKDNQPRGGDMTSVGDWLRDTYEGFDRRLGGLLPGGADAGAPGGVFGPGPIGTWAPQLGPGTGIVPGGVGAGVLSGQIPLTTDPISYQALKAPKGYVLVKNGNEVVCILAAVAYALGIKKRPRARGGISGRELEAARKVQTFITRHSVARKPKVPLKKRGR